MGGGEGEGGAGEHLTYLKVVFYILFTLMWLARYGFFAGNDCWALEVKGL